jgi:hypothetical protein
MGGESAWCVSVEGSSTVLIANHCAVESYFT